ncbi:MAG: hypothetical protein WCF20_03635 [Methylovirgula sp.]
MDWSWLVGGVAYDIVKSLAGALVVTIAATAVARRALGLLQERKQEFTFAAGIFVLTCILFIFLSPPRPRPNIEADIQQTVGAASTKTRDYIVVFSINIINSGQMPSIIKNWRVTATVSGTTYEAMFPPVPENYTLQTPPGSNPDQPLSITYHKQDNIVVKGLTPIQVGSMLTGILFVDFHNIDPEIFRGIVDYSVTFTDVLSKQYSLTAKSTGRIDGIGAIPGLHTDMVCRIQKTTSEPAASAPDTTASTPPSPFSPSKRTITPY